MKIQTTKQVLQQVVAHGIRLMRDGDRVYLDGSVPAELADAFQHCYQQIASQVIPAITTTQRAVVAELLSGIRVEYITGEKAAKAAVTAILNDSPPCLGLDTETEVKPEHRGPIPVALTKTGTVAKRQPKIGAAGNALNPRRARVRLLQVYGGGDVVYLFDMRRVKWSVVAPLITYKALAIFNAVFDIKLILSSGGPEPTGRIYDTQTAMRLINGTRPNLGDAVKAALGFELPKGLGASDWHIDQLSADQINYAALDPIVTLELWRMQREQFDDIDENAQSIADDATIGVSRMELAGMPIDRERHAQMIVEWEREAKASFLAVRKFIPMMKTPADATAVMNYLADVLDDDQLADWPRTDKGRLSTDKNTLKIHGADVPGIAELLDARQWAKACSTYGQTLLDKVEDGRLYGSFLIAGARTGRASSKDPNLQNMPKRSKLLANFRSIFAAPIGRVIMAFDYSQIELRAMAAISGDETMTELYRGFGRVYRDKGAAKQYDLHTLTASAFSESDTPTSADRSAAKALNFSLSYGSGPRGVRDYAESSYGIKMTREQAVERIAAFRIKYPGVAAWQIEQERRTREDGYASTVGGRRWWWKWRARDRSAPGMDDLEDWRVDDFVSGYERNFSLNIPVQGSCAETMWIALAYIDRALRGLDARVIAVVHDEVVVEAADDPAIIRAVRRIVRSKMTRAWLELFPTAPWRGIVDCGVSPTWAEAH
jgi:DNA polymerase I-like protein with 3'-5' exonuclease and polymerase domains